MTILDDMIISGGYGSNEIKMNIKKGSCIGNGNRDRSSKNAKSW
jgi:hypothetical protein